MTYKAFDESFDALIRECRSMRDSKGKEYANSAVDRLANFKEVGAEIGVDAKVVLMIYLKKHLRSIDSFVKNGKVRSEPIRGRIVDAITYLTLLNGLIEEPKPAGGPRGRIKKRKGIGMPGKESAW